MPLSRIHRRLLTYRWLASRRYLRTGQNYAENALYNNEDQDFESHRFSPWSVHFKSKKRKKGPRSERHTLKFHEILVRSYNAKYLKSLE